MIIFFIVMSTGWTAEGLEFESRWGENFSPLHVIQTESGAQTASCPMGIGGKAGGRREA
jgi:hypothetical protein